MCVIFLFFSPFDIGCDSFHFGVFNSFLFCLSFAIGEPHTVYTISIFKTNVANFDNFFCLDINRTHKTIEMTDTWSTYLTVASC